MHGRIALRLVLYFIIIATSFLNIGCADPAIEAERILPKTTETCGGQALQSKYIVRYKNGKWSQYDFADRQKFKAEVVIPQLNEIDFIEYDQKISLQDFKSSTAQASWNVRYNWGAEAIGSTSHWQSGIYGEGVVVAVIDSGVDVTHPLLRNQIYYNSGESGTDSSGQDKSTNGIDDDGNGYVDDYMGYDFVSNSDDVRDDVAHGTHVAGIIAAEHSDTEIRADVVQGVAPKAKILPIKFLTANGGFMSDALKSIDYAVIRGAQIINASWGGAGCSLALKQKISDLAELNILFVAAAGNSGLNLERYPEFPAAFNLPLQLTVGSITENLLPAAHSNYSSRLVSLFAPGKDIVSTIPGGRLAPYDGTSMAAPFVSGAAALILSAAPHLSLAQLHRRVLESIATDPYYLNQTTGRLSLQK